MPLLLPFSGSQRAALVLAALAAGALLTACEATNPRNEAGQPSAAREAENWKVKRITPAQLIQAAQWAGDSLTHSAERELYDFGLPVDSFRLKRMPETANLARELGGSLAVVPVARPAADVRVSRPTKETFAYVRPAGAGRVWRAYFTRKGVAEFFTQKMRPRTRAEKRAEPAS